ncbi:hypothetical protein N7468_003040 [Penicillium chermesinum]|uniref:Beta-lactamase-related domain-containing protein n=1 Tax=Penicillium chermesinum TaxID=63820 RepID=A0A9W9P6G4_9EURO|nr:uncharacterized protein N7468_003040 [Penicillium chermesinum]KAJ5238421.1 hypothetical protein N7468_003040 [Penicillium chermesinum]
MKLLLILTFLFSANAVNLCPLLGPSWPAPTNLSSDATFNLALQNITTNIQNLIESGKFAGNSLSLQVFDKSESVPLLNFSYTDPSINTTIGVTTVDQNTVFRIGSTSKIFTAFLLLIKDRFHTFNDHVSNYIPEIRDAEFELFNNATKREDGIDFIKWNEITVRELVSHLAGLARDYGTLDLAEKAPLLESLGFPALDPAEIPPCGVPNPCNRTQFFTGLFQAHPIVSVSSTPIYSNAAFQILGYLVEAFSSWDFEDVLKRDIIDPLGLSHTFYTPPDTAIGVIPAPQGEYWWNFAFGDEGPAGGIFSTANDMASLGRAILNNILLSPLNTRRWLKPQSHTSSLEYGVGSPWEIVSFKYERPIDLYTKSGDVGTYSSVFALDPDHDAGFVILAAGNNTHELGALSADTISETLLPALEEAAKRQANTRFSGTYSQNNSNSSITIATDDGPGLVVTKWSNNGTNMLQSYATLNGFTDPSQLDIRLYPTGLTSPGQLSFRAVIPPLLPDGIGPFTSSCITWVTLDSHIYGNIGLDEFVFGIGDDGTADSISPRALRIILPKTS